MKNIVKPIFFLKKLLGSGTWGRVFLAEGPKGPVALKFLHPQLPPSVVAFFRQEVRIQAKLAHPNLVSVMEFWEAAEGWPLIASGEPELGPSSEPMPFFAMEYVKGTSLDSLGKDRILQEILSCLYQASCGLAYLHSRGIYHRDLKGSNLLLTPEGQLKILDFGLATDLTTKTGQNGELKGTPAYAAPEALLGEFDARSDLYSLGVLCYQLLTERFPYRHLPLPENLSRLEPPEDLAGLQPAIPGYLSQLIMKLLALHPDKRPSSARVIQGYLEEHLPSLKESFPSGSWDSSLEKVPWVGRQEELTKLHSLFQATNLDRLCRAVLVTGPTGIGRSRLLEEWKWQAMLEGIRWTSVSPERSEAWWQVLAADLGIAAPTTFVGFLSELEKKQIAPDFSPRLVVLPDLQQYPETELKRLGIFSGVLLTARLPVLLILEFNSDYELPTWLENLHHQHPSQYTRIELTEFSREEGNRFLLQALGGNNLEVGTKASILEAGAGNPLLILEALRGLGEKKMAAPALEGIAVPKNFTEAAEQRIAVLDEASQRFLGMVLTHPDPPGPEELQEALGFDQSFWKRLSDLEARGYFGPRSPEAPEVKWRQPSLREVYHKALPKPLTAQCHLRWIQYLKGIIEKKRDPTERVLQMAVHGLEIMEEKTLAAWGIPALQILESQGDFIKLADWAERMLAIQNPDFDRIHLHAIRAPNFYRLGRLVESRKAYEAWYKLRKKEEEPSGIIAVRYHFYLGLVDFAQKNMESARRELLKSLNSGDNVTYPELRPFHSRALNLLGAIEEQSGNPSRAQNYLHEAVPLAQDKSLLLGEIEQRLGSLAQGRSDWEAAREHFQHALDAFTKSGDPKAVALAHHSLGLLQREMGQYSAALQSVEKSVDLAKQGGEWLQWGRYLGNLGVLAMDLGDYGAATNHLEGAQRILGILGTEEDHLLLQMQQTALASRTGNWDSYKTRLIQLRENASLKNHEKLSAGLELLEWEHACRLRKPLNPSPLPLLSNSRDPMEDLEKLKQIQLQIRSRIWEPASLAAEPLEKQCQALQHAPLPLLNFWGEVLEFARTLDDTVTAENLHTILGKISAWESPEDRMESLDLLSYILRRQGLTALGSEFQAAAAEEWQKIYHPLPEVLKMDFEKNRRLQFLEETLKSAGEANNPAGGKERQTAMSVSKQPGQEALSLLRFRHFCEINRQISQKTDQGEILERVMDAAIELTGAERGFLVLKNESEREGPFPGFEIKSARHLDRNSVGSDDIQISCSAVREAMASGSPLLTNNAQQDERLKEMESVMEYQLKSILVVPLESEGRTIGAIYLDHRYQPDCFSQEDITLLSGFASQASLAIQKAEWWAHVQKDLKNQSVQIEALSKELDQARSGLKYSYEDIIGESPAMLKVFKLLDHVSKTRIPVWIFGESGTGKELIAASLHRNSPRKDGPFITENCSAIPENLLESELFGYKKGAFTHADRNRVGLLELANGGTLFLDEVADMPMAMQVKLLRVLQEGEVRPLGSNTKVKIDVRLVTASNRNLIQLAREGKFREDLLYRINGLTIQLPPLRARKSDIPLLVHHFLKKVAQEYDLQPAPIQQEAMQFLIDRSWPGNIRELEGVIRNILLFAEGKPITRKTLQLYEGLLTEVEGEPAMAEWDTLSAESMGEDESRERSELIEMMAKHHMDKKMVAQELGVSLKTVYARMQRYGIPKKSGALREFLQRVKTE